jgi:hypothetical protein
MRSEQKTTFERLAMLTAQYRASQIHLAQCIRILRQTEDLLRQTANSLGACAHFGEISLNLSGTRVSASSPTARTGMRLDTSGLQDTKATRPKKHKRSSTSGGAKRKARPPARASQRSTRRGAKGAHTQGRSQVRLRWDVLLEQIRVSHPHWSTKKVYEEAQRRYKTS